MYNQPFQIPQQLLLGTATAATHIEGGEQLHNWFRWSDLGKIKDGSHCKMACDHINRIEADVQLIADLGCQTYRMGVEWSRIEPEEGNFSTEGLAIYRKEIEILRSKGILPLVTIWHFSNPLWMEDDGGWTNPKAVDRYLRFTKFVVEGLYDLVSDWITINEPNVYLYFAYFEGSWPPGKKGDILAYFKAARNFAAAHVYAYRQIHKQYQVAGLPTPSVGVAHHIRVFDPFNQNWLSKFSVRLTKYLFQDMFVQAMTNGKFGWPLKKPKGIIPGRYADFMGVNYYSRDLIKGKLNPFSLFGEIIKPKNGSVNDLGWEIYPEGLLRVATELYKKYSLPIFITENGTCDAEDRFRATFIYRHLQQVVEAMEKGIDIQRYYHWSLMDNFEWAEGNSARFGLYHTNYETQERTLRKSGSFYAAIIKNRAVNWEMVNNYLSNK